MLATLETVISQYQQLSLQPPPNPVKTAPGCPITTGLKGSLIQCACDLIPRLCSVQIYTCKVVKGSVVVHKRLLKRNASHAEVLPHHSVVYLQTVDPAATHRSLLQHWTVSRPPTPRLCRERQATHFAKHHALLACKSTERALAAVSRSLPLYKFAVQDN